MGCVTLANLAASYISTDKVQIVAEGGIAAILNAMRDHKDAFICKKQGVALF